MLVCSSYIPVTVQTFRQAFSRRALCIRVSMSTEQQQKTENSPSERQSGTASTNKVSNRAEAGSQSLPDTETELKSTRLRAKFH